MGHLQSFFTALLLCSHTWTASAINLPNTLDRIAHELIQNQIEPHRTLRRDHDRISHSLVRRQAASPSADAPAVSTTPQSQDPAQTDLEAWNSETSQACTGALVELEGQASNPTGLAVCYNLPFLDNTTGVFEAELRMYRISEPVDEWVGTKIEDYVLGFSYIAATVQATRGILTMPRPQLERRQEANAPEELKVLTYVGRINVGTMRPNMNAIQLQPLFIPTILISATNPANNRRMNVTLSTTEASFLTGVFSDQASSTFDPASQASASAIVAAAAAELPGVSLGITPIGFYITLGWSAIFVGSVGMGTIGRLRFRKAYRRRYHRDVVETNAKICPY